LLVPRKDHMADVTEKVADNGQLNLAPEVTLHRTTIRAGKRDTVASLAKKYRVSPSAVAEWNNVSAGASFKSGQQVVLYLPNKARSKKASSSKRSSSSKATSSKSRSRSKVAK
jgi:membrane-bound lytic murein transglycosylase D